MVDKWNPTTQLFRLRHTSSGSFAPDDPPQLDEGSSSKSDEAMLCTFCIRDELRYISRTTRRKCYVENRKTLLWPKYRKIGEVGEANPPRAQFSLREQHLDSLRFVSWRINLSAENWFSRYRKILLENKAKTDIVDSDSESEPDFDLDDSHPENSADEDNVEESCETLKSFEHLTWVQDNSGGTWLLKTTLSYSVPATKPLPGRKRQLPGSESAVSQLETVIGHIDGFRGRLDAQLLIGDDYYRQQDSNNFTDLDELVKKESLLWLASHVSTPVSVPVDQKLYTSEVDRILNTIRDILWSKDGSEIVYQDSLFTITELRFFITQLYDEAESIQAKDLCFATGTPQFFLLALLSPEKISVLRDYPKKALYGYSFLDLADNDLARSAHKNDYLKAFEKIKEYLRAILFFRRYAAENDGDPRPNMAEHRDLQKCVLLPRNGLLTYSKTQSVQGKSRPIGRFLPPRAARLLVLYLATTLPYASFLGATDGFIKSPFVLSDSDGKPWSTAKIGAVFQRLSTRAIGKGLNVSTWRHLMTAIGRKFLRLSQSDLLHGVSEGEEVGDDAFVAQFGHSADVERRVYGQETLLGDLMDWENLQLFLKPSKLSHAFFRVDKDLGNSAKAIANPNLPTVTRPAIEPLSMDAVFVALQKLYGSDTSFRSETQSAAVTCMLKGLATELVVVMPIGFW